MFKIEIAQFPLLQAHRILEEKQKIVTFFRFFPISDFPCISHVKQLYYIVGDYVSYILRSQFVFLGLTVTEILNFKRSPDNYLISFIGNLKTF